MSQTVSEGNRTSPGSPGPGEPSPTIGSTGYTYTFPVPKLPPPPPSQTVVGSVSVIPLVRSFRFVHEPVQPASAARFVGRQHELTAFVERVLFSNGGSFLVTGYRGVGKTSFINQAISRLDDVMKNAESELGRPMQVVPIALNIARPVQPAELMHYIVRRLYDRLVEMGIYPKLDTETRNALKQAYDRTSFNMARKLSESTEKNIGLSDAGMASRMLGVAAKLNLGAKRTRTQNYEMTFLGYDDRAAEHDIITISRRLQQGYVPVQSPWQRLMQWLSGTPASGARRTELKIVFVFDELDKLEEFTVSPNTKKKPVIDDILGSLKNLFTTSGVTFVFVAGKDLQERWLEDVGKGDSVYESVFSYDKYLPCMWADTDTICDHLVDTREQRELQVLNRFKSFLSYKGRGIPRRIVRTFNEYVSWSGNRPELHFSREQLGRIRFFAGLQDTLEENKLVLFGDSREESAGTQSDKRRLGVYYLVDWMMRQSGEFTLSDVVNASRRLSTKIALAEEIAPRVIEDVIQTLLRKDYLQEAQPKLDKVVIGGPNTPGERRYFIPPRRVIEMGGSADELEEDSRLLSTLGRPDDGGVNLTSIGKYRILETIGSGGMGIVYRATDATLGRIVAIKTVQRQLIGEPGVRQRFEREARVMSALSHANVVKFFDAGLVDERPFIVMEYLEGLTLERVVETLGKLSLEMAVAIITPVASALEHIHERGIVRNDLKPANIMLTTTGRLCLLDFGISKFRQEPESTSSGSELTVQGQFVGTPRYSSPEQFTGEVDVASDIYSLGVILYRLLTRVLPIDGENPLEIYQAMRSTRIAPPSKYANVPAAVDAVVLRCLEFAPASRYASVGEFRKALIAAAGGEQLVDLRQLVAETRERAKSLNEWGSESTAVSDEPTPASPLRPAAPPPQPAAPQGAQPVREPDIVASPVERTLAPEFETSAPGAVAHTDEYGTPNGACPNCGAPNANAANRFCLMCGHALARTGDGGAAEARIPSPAAAKAAIRPRIRAVQSDSAFDCSLVPDGDAFLLKPRETTFGRVAQNDIVILSPKVSRYHGRFVVTDTECVVEDYGSSNGTMVNGSRVPQRQALKSGDVVEAGDARFEFLA